MPHDKMSWLCLRCKKSCTTTKFCSTYCSKEYVYEQKLVCSKSGCQDRRNYIKQVLLHHCKHHNQYNVDELGSYIEKIHAQNLHTFHELSTISDKRSLEENKTHKYVISHRDNTINQLKKVNTRLKQELKNLTTVQFIEDPLKNVVVTVSQPHKKKPRYFEVALDEYLANAKPPL